MNPNEFQQIAESIVAAFPGEILTTYYVSSAARAKRMGNEIQENRNAMGRLADQYGRLKTRLRKAGLRNDEVAGTSGINFHIDQESK